MTVADVIYSDIRLASVLGCFVRTGTQTVTDENPIKFASLL